MKKLFIVITIILVLIGGALLVYREGGLPVNKNDKSSKLFAIKQGDTLNNITKNLAVEGFIRSRIVFYIVVKSLGIEKSIQAGDFQLSRSMSAYEIAQKLTHGTSDTTITIIEGLRKEEIAEIIAKNFPITTTEFTSLAEEGYLFPDTYSLPKSSTAQTIINKLTGTFNEKLNKELQEKGKKNGLSKSEIVILASLVEREGRSVEAKKQIASILLKRYKMGMPLQIDATVQYILGYQKDEQTWWKRNLTEDDLKVDSAFNTYKNPGLPPAPICNPGLASIEAVVEADPSIPYLFYITGNDHKMHYAKTLEEHNANISKYIDNYK